MHTILNDGLRPFLRPLAAQVGDALFRNDDVHIVFRMVVMRHHRHDSTDAPFLGHAGAGENGNVGIAREVARTADAVHHARAADMSGVHIAIDVLLDGCIDGNHSQAAYHLRTVGHFGGTQHQLVTEQVHVFVNAVQAVVGHCQGAGAAKLDASFTDQPDHRVLDHFRIHLKRRNGLVMSQSVQHGIGDVPHTGL